MGTVFHRLAIGLCLAIRPWSRELEELVHVLRTTAIPPLSPQLTESLIQAEDHRFRMHFGVDPWAVARALFKTLLCGRRQGASTIQQQLVRVATGRHEAAIRRKLREMVLAVAAGKYFTRDEFLALYLVRGYYGYGMSGLRQACDKLQIDPALASPSDAASLVARLKYPEPKGDSPAQRARIKRRTQHILMKMTRSDRRGLTRHAADSAGAIVSAAADA